MFDLDDLRALSSIVEQQGFAAAAKQLRVTQSAVSQRIQKLEDLAGCPLLVRGTPPRLTTAGERVLRHFKTIQLFDAELSAELQGWEIAEDRLISIAINNDSLCTWFLQSVTGLILRRGIRLQVKLAYEPDTLSQLASGEVSACVTSVSRAKQGCESFPLGKLVYRLVATPNFAKRFFPRGLSREALRAAPTVFFGHRDPVSEEYFESEFGLKSQELSKHLIPSSEGFRRTALLGIAYALHPAIDIAEELKSGALIDLAPRKTQSVTLYWQVPRVRPRIIDELSEAVIQNAAKVLSA